MPPLSAGTLDRRITLLEPGATSKSGGQVVHAQAIRHRRWASRLERGGGESERASTVIGSWQTRFVVRQSEQIRSIDHTWNLIDDRGREFDIETVNEYGGRGSGWALYAVSKS